MVCGSVGLCDDGISALVCGLSVDISYFVFVVSFVIILYCFGVAVG